MEKSINQFFIYNNEILNSTDFNETMVSRGKSIYEVIRVIDGVPLFLGKHIERLLNSVKISNLTLSLNTFDIKKSILELIEINEVETGNVKIVFNYINDVRNDFIAYLISHNYPTVDQYENGVTAILFNGERSNPNAKIINLDFRNIVDGAIKENNAYEAILIDREGNVTEGSKSNIFMVKGNTVITAPTGGVLPGITRQSILDVCIDLGIEVKEVKMNFEELLSMDGVFITGTSPRVLPVNKISPEVQPFYGKVYKNVNFNSCSNEVILKIMKAYDKKIENYINKKKQLFNR